MKANFENLWSKKINAIRKSAFWKQVSSPPDGHICLKTKCPKGHLAIDNRWTFVDLEDDRHTTSKIGATDLQNILASHFGLNLRCSKQIPKDRYIQFQLISEPRSTSKWDNSFTLDTRQKSVHIVGHSQHALLQASIYLSNLMRLQQGPFVPIGKRVVKPSVNLHLAADLWGGFSTTHAWVTGREFDENFLELARMGVNGLPIMSSLEDYIESAPKSFRSLINPKAKQNRLRLKRLAQQSATYGVYIFLVAYNPKLPLDHPVFLDSPNSKGSSQWNDSFRTLCASDPATRDFLCNSWASLFEEIPELGGLLALVGGEGFYHCYMRSAIPDAGDCPRCSKNNPSKAIADFVNQTARTIHQKNPDARFIAWPYSASHWSKDSGQIEFIKHLDRKHVMFQTEIDKDCVDFRPLGYAKNCWDYTAGLLEPSPRSIAQRAICRKKNIPFGIKLEVNNAIECLGVPYLPIVWSRLTTWENCRKLDPQFIHSRWLFDGSCKSPCEELGYWMIWGKGSPFERLDKVLHAIAKRDFGNAASRYVLRAWKYFSEAIRHHPCLDYYIGPYYIGPGQPLVIDIDLLPETAVCQVDYSKCIRKLDPAFFGSFYWHAETDAYASSSAATKTHPLFYYKPGFKAFRRQKDALLEDVALSELHALCSLWNKGVQELNKARSFVPVQCKPRFRQEMGLALHLLYTWQSAKNVEEFLRVRDIIIEYGQNYYYREAFEKQNLTDLNRLKQIAKKELFIVQKDLKVVRDLDFLDLSLRLDMGTASMEDILIAKIKQIHNVLNDVLPKWQKKLRRR